MSSKFKSIALFSFILVHCTNIDVNEHTKLQFKIYSQKKVIKVSVTRAGEKSCFEENAKKVLKSSKTCAKHYIET